VLMQFEKEKRPPLLPGLLVYGLTDSEPLLQRNFWRPVRCSRAAVRRNWRFIPNVFETGFSQTVNAAADLATFNCPVAASGTEQEYSIDFYEIENFGVAVPVPVSNSCSVVGEGPVMVGPSEVMAVEQAGEEEVVEFRCLPPRVESIAALRNKVKLTKAVEEFAKGARLHAFRIESDVEEQSE
jgi:hypothetical protein